MKDFLARMSMNGHPRINMAISINNEKEREWMKERDARRPSTPKKTSKWKSKYEMSDDYSSIGCENIDPSLEEDAEKYLEHDGIERSYIVHLPPSYNHGSDDGHPIVLSLHGYTGTALGLTTFLNGHADANGYIAVYPQGTSLGETEIQDENNITEFGGIKVNQTSWNELAMTAGPSPNGPICVQPAPSYITESLPEECRDLHGCNIFNCLADDVGFIDTLLDELESTYCIDRSRIYVTGYSNGGMMTQRLGCELNHRLAAIAPQIGQLALGYNCEPKHDEPMPIINVWGTNDLIVPGEAVSDGYYYNTPVSHVQYKYGKHNKCNVDEQLPEPIASVSDGILDWQCIGYTGCDRGDGEYGVDTMSCSWNGTHVYPVADGEPFGLNVIWDFFQNHSKVPPRANRHL